MNCRLGACHVTADTIIPCGILTLEKLILAQVIKKFPSFTKFVD
jgi:hypothetical protein